MVRKSTTKQPCVEVAEIDPSTTKNRINAIKIGAILFTWEFCLFSLPVN